MFKRGQVNKADKAVVITSFFLVRLLFLSWPFLDSYTLCLLSIPFYLLGNQYLILGNPYCTLFHSSERILSQFTNECLFVRDKLHCLVFIFLYISGLLAITDSLGKIYILGQKYVEFLTLL